MKKYHMLFAAPVVALVFLSGMIGNTVYNPKKVAPEMYVLGNQGLHCDSELMIVAQMYRFTDATPNKVLPQCRFSGKDHIVKVLQRSLNGIAVEVELEGRPVWVMWVSLQQRAGDIRVSSPKYTPIPVPEPVLTDMQKGKQYL